MRPSRSLGRGSLIAIFAIFALQCSWCVNAWSDPRTPPGSRLSFPIEKLDFPVSPLSFPVTLDTVETSTAIEVTLAADVLFDFDKAVIRAGAEQTLHDLAQIIRDKVRGPPENQVRIQGYTDALGASAYNQGLSERRAASVKAWLVGREKLPPALTTAGFGARDPVAPNIRPNGSDDPEGRQRNRRVTVIIRK